MKKIDPYLNKIEIIETRNPKGLLREGTAGFLHDVRSLSPQLNVVRYGLVLTRVGKTGKPRIETIEFYSEFIETHELSDEKRKLLRGQKGLEYELYIREVTSDCIFTIIPHDRNIMNMSAWDFIAYLTAFSKTIKKVSEINNMEMRLENRGLLRGHPVPARNVRPENLLNTNINDINPIHFYTYTLNAYKYDIKYKTDIHVGMFEEFFKSLENRASVMYSFHKEVAKLRNNFNALSAAIGIKQTSVRERMDMLFRDNQV